MFDWILSCVKKPRSASTTTLVPKEPPMFIEAIPTKAAPVVGTDFPANRIVAVDSIKVRTISTPRTIDLQFQPKNDCQSVIVTGSFDAWSCSQQMVRDGPLFRATISISNVGMKLLFKFIVDGEWQCSDKWATETDPETGYVNNAIDLNYPSMPDTEPTLVTIRVV